MSGMNTPADAGSRFAAAALFWGALWGLGEATVGHLLHLAHIPGLPAAVMIPFGLVMMRRALAWSGGSVPVIPATACVAASLKFLDFFIPGTNPLAVFNPAQAILLEALAVAAVVRLAGEPGASPVKRLAAAVANRLMI
jgi:hypothetical protein